MVPLSQLTKNVSLDKPIQLLYLSTRSQNECTQQVRNLVIAGENSCAALVEVCAGLCDATYFSNAVSEFAISEGANFSHTKIQLESENAYHVASSYIEQGKSSVFSTAVFSFGGKLVRNEIWPTLSGEGISSTFNGLSVLDNEQHVDNFTVVDHAMPHCESNELFKGVFGDKSKGAFSGTIIVRQDAQKTNAIQSNNSILLSTEASCDSRPQLKIYADDVRCTHGATVGQLDEQALFYLRSRGIGEKQAKGILVRAFCGDVLAQLGNEELENYIGSILEKKLDKILV